MRLATEAGLPAPQRVLTCPDFQTIVEFLPTHRRQADATCKVIGAIEADAQRRLADDHRVVLGHLKRIIAGLESLGGDDEQP